MFSILLKRRKILLPSDTTVELFDKVVVPILMFGSGIWGFGNIGEIYIFYKNLLKLNKATPKCMLYA